MKITKDNINNILKEIQEDSFDIPFGNSDYQTIHFMINSSNTPQRAYRNILLRLKDRISAMQENSFNIKLIDNKILKYNNIIKKKNRNRKRLQKELDSLHNCTKVLRNDIEAERIKSDIEMLGIETEKYQIKIDKTLSTRGDIDKLANDTIHEIELLYNIYQKLPKYTREEFESAEEQYFITSLSHQITGSAGPRESLLNMGMTLDNDLNITKNEKALLSNVIQKGKLLNK
jgi:hypothetical protein